MFAVHLLIRGGSPQISQLTATCWFSLLFIIFFTEDKDIGIDFSRVLSLHPASTTTTNSLRQKKSNWNKTCSDYLENNSESTWLGEGRKRAFLHLPLCLAPSCISTSSQHPEMKSKYPGYEAAILPVCAKMCTSLICPLKVLILVNTYTPESAFRMNSKNAKWNQAGMHMLVYTGSLWLFMQKKLLAANKIAWIIARLLHLKVV